MAPQRPKALRLGLPPDVLGLAFGDLCERLGGEREPPFHELTSEPVDELRTVYWDRDTGRRVSAETWRRSRAAKRRQARRTGKRWLPGRVKRGRIHVKGKRDAAGAELAGRTLAARLRALGVGKVRVTIAGEYAREDGGALRAWTRSGITVGGLDPAGLCNLANVITRQHLKAQGSPPIIFITRVTVERV